MYRVYWTYNTSTYIMHTFLLGKHVKTKIQPVLNFYRWLFNEVDLYSVYLLQIYFYVPCSTTLNEIYIYIRLNISIYLANKWPSIDILSKSWPQY